MNGVDPDAAILFLDFVRERHNIWEARQRGKTAPWTADPVLASRKFTNVFRLLDPGSQFVIEHLIHDDPEQTLARCFLYRHTNLPSAWLAYAADTGSMPDVLGGLDYLEEFWLGYKDEGGRVFSGAYMIYPQSAAPGTDKIVSIIDLTRRLFVSSRRVRHDFMSASSQTDRFAVLRMNKGVADFMSMQILTDFGYSTEYREDEFVVPGPGARRGAAALGLSGEDGVEWAWSAIQAMDDVPVFWGSGNRGHFPSKMDAQNCLCEFSKYVRYLDRGSPGQPYSPAHPGVQSTPVLPPYWHTTI